MTLEKAVGEHHAGALIKIQAWRRDDRAVKLHNSESAITLSFVLFANQVTPAGLEESEALCVHVDSVRPSGFNELTLRVCLNAGLLCVSDIPASMRWCEAATS